MIEENIEIRVSARELRYLIACGGALILNLPEKSLATYSGFTKEEIMKTTAKLRKVLEDHGLDL